MQANNVNIHGNKVKTNYTPPHPHSCPHPKLFFMCIYNILGFIIKIFCINTELFARYVYTLYKYQEEKIRIAIKFV